MQRNDIKIQFGHKVLNINKVLLIDIKYLLSNLIMSDVSKFMNLLVEFGEKLDGHLNKKYRPFIKSLLIQNVQQRGKSMNPEKVALSQQMIAFKLGIESKSTKCIQLTLGYLFKLFNLGFINLNAPNYCEDFVITQSNIQRKKNQKYEKEMKNEILKWLQPLVHFKNNQINVLVLKNYEFLIGEPILPSLIQISEQCSNQLCYSLMCSYFNYRFYLFEEVYLYTKQQISQFKHLPANEKLSEQINNATDREENFENLIEKYLNQIVAKVCKEGGKYGFCVVCDHPAEYFCKITKASLCGIQCKKAHLETADKQYQNFYQSVYLNGNINEGITTLCKNLADKESAFLFSVMASLMEKPYLFQLVKIDFKAHIRNYLPGILYKAYQSKNEQIIQTLYFMIASLAKWWPTQCLPQIQFFIKEHILKVLKDKKPNFRLLILVFKFLDKIFQNGRSIVELYVNLDCQVNQSDVISNTLFQLSKIAQDKFANSNSFNKQQKITIKNSCMTLFMTFSRSLNDFRRNYPSIISVKEIDIQKTRKANLQKFVQKFNEHWSEGLKTLFNLNLVGLDSNQQIVNIIMSLAGLKKSMIDLMMFEKTCEQYLGIFMSRLQEEDEPLVFKLLSFYKYIPMTESNSISLLKFVEEFKNRFGPDLMENVKKITHVLMKSETVEDFKQKIKIYLPQQADYRYLYLRMLTARKPQTIGKKKQMYTLCLSQSYLEPISSQISLLQIPLSYMLQTSYDADRVVNLIKQLTPICIHSNWLSLLVKHSGIDGNPQQILNAYNIKLIKGILEIAMVKAQFIMDWLTILNFICNVHYLLTQNHPPSKKYLAENKSILSQELTSLMVQNCLINTSIKAESNFSRFMGAVLTIAKQHLGQDQIMMLQKFFHMLDANIDKYLANFDAIFEEFTKFIEELKPKTSSQTYIYITDMLKQLLLKVLKSTDIKDETTLSHLQIFRAILNKNKDNKEVGDFVMNSLSTIVVYNYNLKRKAWRQAIMIVDQEAYNFPYQAGVIIRKILNEHMKNIEDSGQVILQICLKLIKPDDYKSSIESIHNIKLCIDIQRQFIENSYEEAKKLKNENQNAEKQEDQLNFSSEISTLKKIVIFSICSLIQLLGESFSDTVAQTLFSLFSIKLSFNEDLNLSETEISRFVEKIMNKLEIMEIVNLQAAEGIMNRTLFWSDNNGYKNIIKNLESVILGKYTNLSVSAIKCIKTYIQMAKLKEEKQWEDVQSTLLKIIERTQVERFFNLQKQVKVQEIITDLIQNKLAAKINLQNNVDLNVFVHECQQQMRCVQLLPNHEKCLDILTKVYDEKVQFNDMVVSRVGLWKKGLGREFPPDLLNLEQTISNRIMSIYLRQQNNEHILSFTYKILKKYIDSSKIVESLESCQAQVSANCNNQNYQLYNVLIDYWKKRRQPLIKLIGYMMPKLSNQCKRKQDRKQLLLYFVKIMPIVENKEGVLKTISELAEKNIG